MIWKRIEESLYFLIVKIFHIDISEVKWMNIMRFLRFGIVGISNTMISYFLYLLVILLCRFLNWFENFDYVIAEIFSFGLSVLWSFYWNSRFVFDKENMRSSKTVKQILLMILKTYISYSITGLFLNSILLMIWVEILKISEIIAPLLNLIVTVPTNYVIQKFWVFKKKG